MEITGKDLQYLKESYKHETNKVLAKRMGMYTSSISRLARNFGLQKSREHLLEVKRESIARATQKFQFGKDAISSRIEDYEKIIHICQERINQLKTGECWEANIDMQSIEKIRKALKNREI